MNTNSPSVSIYTGKHSIKYADAEKRLSDQLAIKLLEHSMQFRKRPDNWSERNKINYLPTKEVLSKTFFRLPEFSKNINTHLTLSNYLEELFVRYLDNIDKDDHLFVPEMRILRYLRNGDKKEIRLAAESSFLLYALGPFTFFDEKKEVYFDSEHRLYHDNLVHFGKKIYHFYLGLDLDNNEIEDVTLMIFDFRKLGNSFRKFAWRFSNSS